MWISNLQGDDKAQVNFYASRHLPTKFVLRYKLPANLTKKTITVNDQTFYRLYDCHQLRILPSFGLFQTWPFESRNKVLKFLDGPNKKQVLPITFAWKRVDPYWILQFDPISPEASFML